MVANCASPLFFGISPLFHTWMGGGKRYLRFREGGEGIEVR